MTTQLSQTTEAIAVIDKALDGYNYWDIGVNDSKVMTLLEAFTDTLPITEIPKLQDWLDLLASADDISYKEKELIETLWNVRATLLSQTTP